MRYLIALLLFLPSIAQAVPAFPGAVGHGSTDRHAFACGGSPTWTKVTNLNATGSGSFHAAWTASGARVIVFEVSGTITINDEIKRGGDCVAVYGETAPAPGITFRGATFNLLTGGQTADHVLLKHVRILVGDTPISVDAGNRDGFRAQGSNPVILDHVTLGWSLDEQFSAISPANITCSRCLVFEALDCSIHPEGCHSFGPLIGDGVAGFTLYKSLLAHNSARNPRFRADKNEIVNSIFYNASSGVSDWAVAGDDSSNIVHIDFRGNYYKCGPETGSCSHEPLSATGTTGLPAGISASSDICVANNIHRNHAGSAGSRTTDTGSEWLVVDSRLPEGTHSVSCPGPATSSTIGTVASPTDNYTDIVTNKNVGMRPAEMAGGSWNTAYARELEVLAEVAAGTGSHVDSVSAAGGWPTVQENTYTLSVPASPNADTDADGYTDGEEWVYDNYTTLVEPETAPGGGGGGGGGGGNAFRVQRCRITFGASADTGTCTLSTAVVTARTFLKLNNARYVGGYRADGSDASLASGVEDVAAHVVLTNTTTITATRASQGTDTDIHIDVEAIEYIGADGGGNEIDVYRGTTTFGAATTATSAAIGSLTSDAKCIPNALGSTAPVASAGSRFYDRILYRLESLTDAGTAKVRATRAAATTSVPFSWELICFVGSNWTVANNCALDLSTITAGDWTDNTICDSVTVADWTDAFITSTHTPTAANDNPDDCAWLIRRKSGSSTAVQIQIPAGSDNATSDRAIVYHVVKNTGLSVRHINGTYQISQTAGAGQYHQSITLSPALTNLDQAFSILYHDHGAETSSAQWPRTEHNYRIQSTTVLQVFEGRADGTPNTYTYEAQVIDDLPEDASGGETPSATDNPSRRRRTPMRLGRISSW